MTLVREMTLEVYCGSTPTDKLLSHPECLQLYLKFFLPYILLITLVIIVVYVLLRKRKLKPKKLKTQQVRTISRKGLLLISFVLFIFYYR